MKVDITYCLGSDQYLQFRGTSTETTLRGGRPCDPFGFGFTPIKD